MAFRVPEGSRVTDGPMGTPPHAGLYGNFLLPSPEPGWMLQVIADNGSEPESDGWEHVSVCARASQSRYRVPTWKEMVFLKGVFWEPEDVVVQFHPAASAYVNLHPHVLHLWRHPARSFPTPPMNLVG